MVKLDDARVWLSWIQYLSFIRYGFENACVVVFRDTNVKLDNGAVMSGMDVRSINFSSPVVSFCSFN